MMALRLRTEDWNNRSHRLKCVRLCNQCLMAGHWIQKNTLAASSLRGDAKHIRHTVGCFGAPCGQHVSLCAKVPETNIHEP